MTTKYQEAVEEIPKLKKLIEDMNTLLGNFANGERNTVIDKKGMTMTVRIDRSWYGSYGSSSVYSVHTPALTEVMNTMVNSHYRYLLEKGISHLQLKINQLAKAAEEEAKDVLSRVKETMEG